VAQPIFRPYQARIQSAGRMNQREVMEPDIIAPASNDSLTHTESVPPTAHHRLPPRQHSMRRPRLTRGGPLTGVLALVLALLPIVACSRPHLHDLLPPSATPSAVVMANPNQVDLVKIAMLAPNDGWAVGAQGTILHYNGVSWSPVISPTDSDLLGISMVTPHEGWAVGASHYSGTVQLGTLLHFSNGRWTMVPSPTTSYLDSIDMVSPTEGWAVGKDILQYSAGRWTKAPNPDGGQLSRSGVAMLSADTGWAVSSEGFIMQCRQGVWTNWSVPNPARKLYAVAMVSPDEGWAVGEAYAAGGIPVNALLLHYSNQVWTAVQVPAAHYLYAISMVSSSEGWAVGAGGTILHDSGGHWQAVTSPTPFTLRGIFMLSASEGWAVGVQGTILHFTHGEWVLYH